MDTLYHYTSLNGILGILQSRSIWATHASYLNDASEFLHGLSLGKKMAGGIYMDDDYISAFGWAVRRALEKVSADNLYVSSFSEKADLLSQWRGYCPPGAGLCLGLDVTKLREFCGSRGYRLDQCIYDHEEHYRQIADLVNQCLDRFPKPKLDRGVWEKLETKKRLDTMLEHNQRIDQGEDKAQAETALAWLCTEITELTPLFKNEGFHEEAEWRIIAMKPREQVKFRANRSYLAPYVELEILSDSKLSALREVIIGPNPNSRRCATSIKALLESYGLSDVEIKTSPIPFNSW